MNVTLESWDLTFLGRPDVDEDGLPDDWERAFFGSRNLDSILPDVDENEDGKTNYEHFVDGTDPLARLPVVYKLSQRIRSEGQGGRETSRRKGILVSERSNEKLIAVLA